MLSISTNDEIVFLQNMKRFFTLLYILTCFVCMYAQEYWSKESGRYTNWDYGFVFNFNPEYGFEKVLQQSRHTVFRAEAFDGLLTAFVNVNAVGATMDPWDTFEQQKELLTKAMNKNEALTGEKVTKIDFEKTILAGHHAIKYIYWTQLRLEGLNEPVRFVSTTYVMNEYKQTWQVSIKVLADAYDKGEIMQIASGFKFTTK